MKLAWEQRKLGETLISLQNNTLSRAELSNEQGSALNVHYGDVLIKFGEYLDVRKEALPLIPDSAVVAKYKASFLQNGDIIVADTAEDETVGKCSEIAGLSDEIAISGLHTIPYRPQFRFASGFLGYYMNSNSYHQQLLPLMQGIKVTSISKSAMRNTAICYPKTEDEQAEISAFFRNLDNLITLHQREEISCGSFESTKTNLFFTPAWEQRKLGEITNSYSGGTPSVGNKSFYGGSIPFIRSGEINSEETELFLTEDGLKGSSAKMVEIGDILYALYGATSGEVSISRISGAINQAILAIKPLNDYNPSFIMQWLRKEKGNIIGTYLQGGQGNLSGNIVKELMVYIPGNKTEQDEIGTFFIQLDKLITLHQREEKMAVAAISTATAKLLLCKV